MNRRGASHAARPADGGRAISWAALASDSDSDSVASGPAVTPAKPQGKKVLVAPGAPRKALKTTLDRLMDPLAFSDVGGIHGPLPPSEKDSVVVKEVAAGKGYRVMDVTVALPAPPAPSTADLERRLAELLAADPEMVALNTPGVCWGDIFAGPVAPAPAVVEDEERPLRGTYSDFWAQPFTDNLDEYTADVYDTRRLTDEEWNAMMKWLYWKGWWIGDYTREWISAEPDDLPARYWCPPRPETPDPSPVGWGQNLPAKLGGPDEYEEPAKPCKVVRWDDAPADHSSSCCCAAAAPKAPKKKALRAAGLAPVPVMRFCRAGEACPEKETGCRYVHGDTIPKIDKPCGFGAECGASDATGLKRSQCIYMHPGEEWSADLCIHRP